MQIINVGRLAAWDVVQGGEFISLPGGKRDIEIAFRTARPTPIMILTDGRLQPLGVANGATTFRLKVEGDVELHPDTDDVISFRTQDGQRTALHSERIVTFTTAMERTPRNLAEEQIQFVAMQNHERRARMMDAAAEMRSQRATDMLEEATRLLAEAKKGTADAADDKTADGGVGGSGPKADAKPPVSGGKSDKSGASDDKSGAA